jgi:hypothetical protein
MPRATAVRPVPPPSAQTARQPIQKTTTFKEVIEPPGESIEEQVAQTAPSRKEEVRQELQEYQFWEKLQKMSAKDWEHSIAYVYRHKGEYKEEGKPWDKPPRGAGYLEKFTQPFTIEDIRERFGGGDYWCIVNYDQGSVFSGSFRIIGQPKAESQLVIGQAASGDQKTEFLITLVKDSLAEIKAERTKPDEAIARVMEVMTKANDATIQMLVKQLPEKVDPMVQLTNLLGALQQVKTLQAPSAPPASEDGGLMKSLEFADRLGLLKKANEDPLGNVGKLVEGLKALGIFPSVGGGSGRDDWKVAFANVAPDLLRSVEGIVRNVVQGILQTRSPSPVQVAQMAAQRARPGAILAGTRGAPAGAPGTQPAAPATAPGAPAGNPAAVPPAGSEAEQIQQVSAIVENWLWIRLVELFNAGTTGDDVASFLQLAAPEAATFFGAQTPAQLETMISQHPILGQMSNHPRLKAFLE